MLKFTLAPDIYLQPAHFGRLKMKYFEVCSSQTASNSFERQKLLAFRIRH